MNFAVQNHVIREDTVLYSPKYDWRSFVHVPLVYIIAQVITLQVSWVVHIFLFPTKFYLLPVLPHSFLNLLDLMKGWLLRVMLGHKLYLADPSQASITSNFSAQLRLLFPFLEETNLESHHYALAWSYRSNKEHVVHEWALHGMKKLRRLKQYVRDRQPLFCNDMVQTCNKFLGITHIFVVQFAISIPTMSRHMPHSLDLVLDL